MVAYRFVIKMSVLMGTIAFFWRWYGGPGKKIEPDELQKFEHLVEALPESKLKNYILPRAKELVSLAKASHGGNKEMIVVSLCRARNGPAVYPIDSKIKEQDISAEIASWTYVQNVATLFLKRACHPLFLGSLTSVLTGIKSEPTVAYETILIMRYRSIRDYMEILTELLDNENRLIDHSFAGLENELAYIAHFPDLGLLIRIAVSAVLLLSYCAFCADAKIKIEHVLTQHPGRNSMDPMMPSIPEKGATQVPQAQPAGGLYQATPMRPGMSVRKQRMAGRTPGTQEYEMMDYEAYTPGGEAEQPCFETQEVMDARNRFMGLSF